MNAKDQMPKWIIEALDKLGGTASIVEVARHIWEQHEAELRASGDYFYKWQYQMRWDAQKLQDAGKLKKRGPNGKWAVLH